MGRYYDFRFLAWAGAMLLGAGMFAPVRAQDPDDARRAVARISLINGEVSVRRGDSGDWVAGVINAPLLADDRISTGPNSRAEVQFDSANVLRLGGNAEVRLTQLEYGRYQMELARGTATYRVLRESSADVEVDTPTLSVRPSKQGTYRISVNDAGETQVTARAGDVEVFTPRGSQWVNAGQTLMARGTAADPEFQIVGAIGYDDWDRWNENRDRALLRSNSYRYVGPGVYGVEDLDPYGSWNYVEPYGNVWRPTVVGDWAPYQSGRWVWEDWYGWTWVSYDPWGWAPYHYGRWFHHARFGWCWYPGVIGVRHFWSPALVAFFGFGHGGGFGFGFGNIGWVPLAPFEVFHPWWGRGFYGRNNFNQFVNITNVNITNIYRNAGVRNGIAGVNVNDFRTGRFNNVMRVSGQQIREAGVIRGQMPIAPGNAHLRFSNRDASFVPRSNENMRFFTHRQPAPAERLPFAQQQRGVTETPNRAASGVPGAGQGSPVQNGFRGQQARPAIQDNAAGNWRRFGTPAGQGAAPQTAVPRTENNGWRGMRQGPTMQNTRPEGPAMNQAPASRNDGRNGGWQRFGAPGGNQAAPRGVERQVAPPSNRGWNRFGDPGTTNSAPRQQYTPAPRQESRSSSGFGGSAAPRYSPPSRESAPSYSAPRSYSGGGGYSAPRGGGNSSTPRNSGGGGSGHSRGNEGGGNRGSRSR